MPAVTTRRSTGSWCSTRDQLVVGTDARLRTVRGAGDVRLTEANLDSVLQATGSVFDGRYHALASRFLDGVPLGPVRHRWTRPTTPTTACRTSTGASGAACA